MNKLKRMDIDLFKDGTFRLNAHFDGVGFGMNFPKQPDWKKVVIRLHSLADMIDSHFAERTDENEYQSYKRYKNGVNHPR